MHLFTFLLLFALLLSMKNKLSIQHISGVFQYTYVYVHVHIATLLGVIYNFLISFAMFYLFYYYVYMLNDVK